MSKKIKETDAIRVYGPYLHKKSGRIAWYVLLPGGKKHIFRSKSELLQFVDKRTTNIKP